MAKPNIITTPGGEQMAVIPLADYERLVAAAADAADVRSYDEVKRRIAAGEEELIPSEFANRILDGESPIRVWREYREMTVAALARRAGLARPYLTQLETGKRAGTIETMRRVAKALDVSINDLT